MFGTLFWGTEHCLLDIDTCLKRSPWALPAALLPSVNDRSCKSEVVGLRSPQLIMYASRQYSVFLQITILISQPTQCQDLNKLPLLWLHWSSVCFLHVQLTDQSFGHWHIDDYWQWILFHSEIMWMYIELLIRKYNFMKLRTRIQCRINCHFD